MIFYGSDVNKLSLDSIEMICTVHDAVYLGCHQLLTDKNLWSTHCYSCFWCPSIDPFEYFGVYWKNDELFMTDAVSILLPFKGIKVQNNSITWSRHKYDKRFYKDIWIDGGRDNVHTNSPENIVNLEIRSGEYYVNGELDDS